MVWSGWRLEPERRSCLNSWGAGLKPATGRQNWKDGMKRSKINVRTMHQNHLWEPRHARKSKQARCLLKHLFQLHNRGSQTLLLYIIPVGIVKPEYHINRLMSQQHRKLFTSHVISHKSYTLPYKLGNGSIYMDLSYLYADSSDLWLHRKQHTDVTGRQHASWHRKEEV